MNNSFEGLMRVNNMIVNYRVDPVTSVTPSDSKQKKKVKGAGGQISHPHTTKGSCTRTRSKNQEKANSIFIMDELESINRKVIYKNADLLHSYQ